MTDHIGALAARLREASAGCLLHYRLADPDGGSITETVGLTSREQLALAVQILSAWCDDEGADHDEVLGSMRVSDLVERMGLVEDEPVYLAACCARCRHASPVPCGSGDHLSVTCQRSGVEMPRTLVCLEFTPGLRVVE